MNSLGAFQNSASRLQVFAEESLRPSRRFVFKNGTKGTQTMKGYGSNGGREVGCWCSRRNRDKQNLKSSS